MAGQLSKVLSRVRTFARMSRARRLVTLETNEYAVSPACAGDVASSAHTVAGPRSRSAQQVDAQSLKAESEVIAHELALRVDPCTCSQAVALDEVLILVFGERRSDEERLRFLVYAAPFARKLVLSRVDKDQHVLDKSITVADVYELYDWCNHFDRPGARMLDLYYVADLSAKQIARALQMHPAAVVRDLRFLKAWLRVKLGKTE